MNANNLNGEDAVTAAALSVGHCAKHLASALTRAENGKSLLARTYANFIQARDVLATSLRVILEHQCAALEDTSSSVGHGGHAH